MPGKTSAINHGGESEVEFVVSNSFRDTTRERDDRWSSPDVHTSAPHLFGSRNAARSSGPSRKGTVLVRLCETEQRHEQLSLPRLRTMLATVGGSRSHQQLGSNGMDISDESLDGEKLPVVELKPFTQKEWRPARSRPVPDRSPSALSNPLPLGSSRRHDFESLGYVDPNKNPGAVTPRGMDAPCPRVFSCAGERLLNHPKAKTDATITSALPYGQQGIVQPFITKLEREKSTVDEIKTGHSQAVQFSCAKRPEVESSEFLNYQNINITGRKLNNPPRTSAIYYSPWEYYSIARSLHDLSRNGAQRNNPESNANHHQMNNILANVDQMHNVYLDEQIYDSFDRSNTLPSIQVNKAALKKRNENLTSDNARMKNHSGSSKSLDNRRLGVTNTLDLLSHYGQPSGVEQYLSDHLKFTLDGIRRSKPFGFSGALRSSKNYEFLPTAGEQSLHSGKRANTRSHPRSSTASITVTSSRGPRGSHGWLSRATTYIDSGTESLTGGLAPGYLQDGKSANRSVAKVNRKTSGNNHEFSASEPDVRPLSDKPPLQIGQETIVKKNSKTEGLRPQMTSIHEQEKEFNSSYRSFSRKSSQAEIARDEQEVIPEGGNAMEIEEEADEKGDSGSKSGDWATEDEASPAQEEMQADQLNDMAATADGDDATKSVASIKSEKLDAESKTTATSQHQQMPMEGTPATGEPKECLGELNENEQNLETSRQDGVFDDSSDDSSVSHTEDEQLQQMITDARSHGDQVEKEVSEQKEVSKESAELAF